MIPAFLGPQAFAQMLAEHREAIRGLLASGSLKLEG
jgi:hypothetical protein